MNSLDSAGDERVTTDLRFVIQRCRSVRRTPAKNERAELLLAMGVGMTLHRETYTLGDLLSDSELGLELLSGDDAACATPLLGAHAIELEQPAKWLDRGWMMLTMGVRLRNKPQAQRNLIAELQDLGATSLGFGVGLSFKSVPPALLDEAKRRNFPVVLVPEDTQFRDVTRAVFHSTVGMESTTFRRLSSIQQNLLRGFTEERPLESLVQRLGRLVHAPVAIMSLDGEVDTATSTLPVPEIALALSDYSEFPLAEFTTANLRIMAAPVSQSTGPSARWLVIASREDTQSAGLDRAAIQVAAPLVDALLRVSQTSLGQDRAIRQALLDSVLDSSSDAVDVRALSAKLNALGIDFDGEFRAIVVRDSGDLFDRSPGDTAADSCRRRIHECLGALGANYLLSYRAGECVVVIKSGPDLSALASEVTAAWPSVSVGVGRAMASVQDLWASYRDAQIATQHLIVQGDAGVKYFEDLDVITQLLAEIPLERFMATAGPIAALLIDNPIQFEALSAYFAHDRDVKAAAEAIYLHPNTLRYRLERLEQALGRSLREPSVTASLYCVMTLMPDLVRSLGQQSAETASTVTRAESRFRNRDLVSVSAADVCGPPLGTVSPPA